MSAADAAAGAALRKAGLCPRALAAWAGTDRLSALPHVLPHLPRRPPVRAAAALSLFVAGEPVDSGLLPVIDLGSLVDIVDGVARARLAVLPLGLEARRTSSALVVCDRLDATPHAELACWPDDSSYHLASAIPPGRRRRWIDLACGSAFAQLARPELAETKLAIDLNPRAVELAALGARLSGIAIDTHVGDISSLHGRDDRAELVTCNAPIPDGGDVMWRSTDDAFFARLFATIPSRLAPAGLAVVHAARRAIPDELPGDRAILTYTPDGARAFCILWWQPAAADRFVERRRELTVARPHVDAVDHETLRGAS